MIKWYDDENMAIFFSEKPDPDVLFPTPEMSDEEKKDVSEMPFLHKKQITITLFDKTKAKKYQFRNKPNYRWDGASIPRMFWRLIGAKTDSRFLIPSFVHDLMCENKHFVNYDRYFSTCVLERMLFVSNVPAYSRWLMKHSVDNFQKTREWRANKCST